MKASFLFSFFVIFSLCVLILSSHCSKRPDAGAETTVNQDSYISETTLLKGKELYKKNACQTCHGLLGDGDGPAGKNLNPPPRSYKNLESYKQGHTVEEITNTLLTGVPGTSMAAYAHLNEEDRKAIATYVVSLQKTK